MRDADRVVARAAEDVKAERPLLRRVALDQHTTLVIRRTTAGDEDQLRSLFEGLTPDDSYRRFFSGGHPRPELLQRLARANESDAVELVATVECDGEATLVGEAGAWPLPNGNAELGITVARRWRGWLGPYLLDALCEAASAEGVRNLEADVLVTNRSMLALLRGRGVAVAPQSDPTIARLVIATAGRVPGWAPADHHARLLLESSSTSSQTIDELVAAGGQVLICRGPATRVHGVCPALAGAACPLAADADAILLDLDAPSREGLAAAHAELHPGVPVCVRSPGEPGAAAATLQLLDPSTRH